MTAPILTLIILLVGCGTSNSPLSNGKAKLPAEVCGFNHDRSMYVCRAGNEYTLVERCEPIGEYYLCSEIHTN